MSWYILCKEDIEKFKDSKMQLLEIAKLLSQLRGEVAQRIGGLEEE